LKEGGYFFGLVIDGNMIFRIHKDNEMVFDSPSLHMEKRWDGEPQMFGSEYGFFVKDSPSYEAFSEYLVALPVIQYLCEINGMMPIINYPVELIDILYSKDKDQVFKHFEFRSSEIDLTAQCMMYTTFVFQKMFTKPLEIVPTFAGTLEEKMV